MSNCKNCGHDSHCGISCRQDHKDGDGNDVNILCCSQCVCDNCVPKEWPDNPTEIGHF